MTLDTYGHVFDELEDAEPVTAEDLIRAVQVGADSGCPGCDPNQTS